MAPARGDRPATGGTPNRTLARRTARYLALSLALHLLLGAAIAYGIFIKLESDLGTEDFNVELVEPRKATTPRNHADRVGQRGGAPRVSPSHAERRHAAAALLKTAHSKQTAESEAARVRLASTQLAIVAPQPPSAPQKARAQRVTAAAAEAAKAASSAPSARERQRAKIAEQRGKSARDKATLRLAEYGTRPSKPARAKPKPRAARRSVARQTELRRSLPTRTALLLASMAPALVKANPAHLLRAVKTRIATRSRQRAAFRRKRAAERARVNAAFRALVARSRAEARGGRALGRGGRMSGRRGGKRVGLKFYLDGRRVLSSRVVTPPEPIKLPRVRCGAVPLGSTPTTVRMLVTLEGGVDVAYIKHTSGSRRFDHCAIKQAKGMRFKPGLDESGKALDVWIHLRVQPSLSLAGR